MSLPFPLFAESLKNTRVIFVFSIDHGGGPQALTTVWCIYFMYFVAIESHNNQILQSNLAIDGVLQLHGYFLKSQLRFAFQPLPGTGASRLESGHRETWGFLLTGWPEWIFLCHPQERCPCDSDSKESAHNVGHPGSIPGLGRSPGEGNGSPLQCVLAWKIPWTEEPGGLESMGLQRVRCLS